MTESRVSSIIPPSIFPRLQFAPRGAFCATKKEMRKMKKFLTLGFAAAAALALATGCQKKEAAAPEATPAAEAPAVVEETGTAVTTTTETTTTTTETAPVDGDPGRPLTSPIRSRIRGPREGACSFLGSAKLARSAAALGGSPPRPRPVAAGLRASWLARRARTLEARAPGPRTRVALPRRVSRAAADRPARLPRRRRDPPDLGLQPLPPRRRRSESTRSGRCRSPRSGAPTAGARRLA